MTKAYTVKTKCLKICKINQSIVSRWNEPKKKNVVNIGQIGKNQIILFGCEKFIDSTKINTSIHKPGLL